MVAIEKTEDFSLTLEDQNNNMFKPGFKPFNGHFACYSGPEDVRQTAELPRIE